jgi:hypothetical protein
VKIQVALSWQAVQLMQQIAERGIWGSNVEEVAARLINEGLEQFVVRPTLGTSVGSRKQ